MHPSMDFTTALFCPLSEGECKSGSRDSVCVAKRSNLSLASSTCSASKFVVDPVNEAPPSPCLPPLPESKDSPHSTKDPLSPIETPPGSLNSLKPKNPGILTKLNNLKNASYGSRGALSGGSHPKHAIIRKVKHRNCCAIM